MTTASGGRVPSGAGGFWRRVVQRVIGRPVRITCPACGRVIEPDESPRAAAMYNASMGGAGFGIVIPRLDAEKLAACGRHGA